MSCAQKTKDRVFSGSLKLKALLHGLNNFEPLIEVAREGLTSAGVSESDQITYARRICKRAKNDISHILMDGFVSSERAQIILLESMPKDVLIYDRCRMVLNGALTSAEAQEIALKCNARKITPELANALLLSGKVSSARVEILLAQALFEASTEKDSVYQKICGRIATKLLSCPINHEALVIISGMMLNAYPSDITISEKAYLLLRGLTPQDVASAAGYRTSPIECTRHSKILPIKAQDNLSMIVFDENHCADLLSSELVTSEIAQARLSGRISDPKKAYELLRKWIITGKDARLILAKTITEKMIPDGETLAYALTHYDLK